MSADTHESLPRGAHRTPNIAKRVAVPHEIIVHLGAEAFASVASVVGAVTQNVQLGLQIRYTALSPKGDGG